MRLKRTPLILLFLLPLFSSCINNANFDQIDLNADPIFEASLVFFELTQFDFLDETQTIETLTLTDVTDIDVFQTSTVRDNLRRVDLLYTVRNEFDRGYTISGDLLDESGNVTYSFQTLSFGPGVTTRDHRENINIENFPAVLNTTQMRFTISLVPSTEILDTSVERRIQFESVGIFYLNID